MLTKHGFGDWKLEHIIFNLSNVSYRHTKCRTTIKTLFLYFNLCPSVILDILSCSFTSISFLNNYDRKNIHVSRPPNKLRICAFYAIKMSKNACIIRSECTITHTYCCVSKLSKFGAYVYTVNDNTLTIHFCLWEIPRNYFLLYFSKERTYTSEGYRMFAFPSIDLKRDLIGCLR